MTYRMNEMQELINRRDEVILKLKEVEKKHSNEIKLKKEAARLAHSSKIDTSPVQSVELN